MRHETGAAPSSRSKRHGRRCTAGDDGAGLAVAVFGELLLMLLDESFAPLDAGKPQLAHLVRVMQLPAPAVLVAVKAG